MSERKAVTRQVAVRYRGAPKSEKAVILDELCALAESERRSRSRCAVHQA